MFLELGKCWEHGVTIFTKSKNDQPSLNMGELNWYFLADLSNTGQMHMLAHTCNE